MIKLEMLRTFRAVAGHGALAPAAAALGRTPSAVSMTLAQLEAEVGAPLFESDRKNRLTPLGHLVLEESLRATDAFARSLSAIRRYAQSTAGTVRIAAVPSVSITILPGVIARFRCQRPDVLLEISDLDSAEVRRRIAADAADIGIVSTTPDDPTGGEVILRDDLGIVAARGGAIDRALADDPGLGWAALACEPLIANPLCAMVHHPAVVTALSLTRLEARNTTALLSFVRGGLGATILPLSSLTGQETGLIFHAPQSPRQQRDLRKIRAPDRRPNPASQAFWEALGAQAPA